MKENEAQASLKECEQNLRRLVAEAAAEGDYTGVVRITDWAKAVGSLLAESMSGPRALVRSESGNGHAHAGALARLGTATQPAPTGRRGRPALDEYPRFFRRGDELVKVGWSKKERREYNHRAPRQALDAVVAAVRQVGAKGRLFNGDALLPLKTTTGDTIPDYQGYVALAWLKHLKVLEQRGRKTGYSLVPEKQIESTVTAAWPELAEWRG